MRLHRFVTAAFVLFLFSTTFITAQKGDCCAMQKRCNLSDSQIESVKSLKSTLDKDMIDLKADMEKLKLEKKDLYKGDNFSKSTLKTLEEKIIAQQTKIRMRHLDFRMGVYDLLDDKQKEEWKNTAGDCGNGMMKEKKNDCMKHKKNCKGKC